jgi:hypothetical protein
VLKWEVEGSRPGGNNHVVVDLLEGREVKFDPLVNYFRRYETSIMVKSYNI